MLDFAQLKTLVAHATRKDGGQFYRRLYDMPTDAPMMTINSLEEWHALPVVTKDDLIACPLEERSFLPLSELDHLRASSGTSGKPPLFSPRTHVRNMEYRLQHHDFKYAFLGFTVPLMPHWHEQFQAEHGNPVPVVVHDPKRPAATARLAAAAGVDAFSVFAYHVVPLGEEMKKVGMNERIRCIEITGEICSRVQYEYIRATFPHAKILQSYNSSEVEDAHIGMPCKPIDGTEPLAVYHPKETHYLELIDATNGSVLAPESGAEGDLLVTAYPGEPASFPLIRFRIGDTARVVEETCAHGTWSFTVLGRTDMDFLKVPGGILRADEIARVLKRMPERVSDVFELHASEIATPSGPQLKAVLHVEMRGDTDLLTLAADISTMMRVAPSMTYADGVASKRYVPLTCQLLKLVPGGKTKRIIRD